MRWDPDRYLEFAAERGRPFDDLIARVVAALAGPGPDAQRHSGPQRVLDLGCGPGNLTRRLARLWPEAEVTGVDSSPEMIARAQATGGAHDPEVLAGPIFRLGDLRDWAPQAPVDVLVSNATLQWLPDHLELLPRLVSLLRPGGVLGVQVPGNFADRSHTAMRELADSPRWSRHFTGADPARLQVADPATYLASVAALGCRADVWETTYLHVLQGPDAVTRWVSGTGLRPFLAALPHDDARAAFLDDYRGLVAKAYPKRAWGTVLPFRRIFLVARAPDAATPSAGSALPGSMA